MDTEYERLQLITLIIKPQNANVNSTNVSLCACLSDKGLRHQHGFYNLFVFNVCFCFFYSLLLQDDILSFDEEKQAVYLQVYRPVYFQLVDVLLHKSHYPSQEEYASWSSDDKEQFRIYR